MGNVRESRVATDVGGTFTDLIALPADGKEGVRIVKVNTSPGQIQNGVFNALGVAGIEASQLDFFAHGSTVVINAITERKGVKTALVTTRGFRDILEIGRGNRPDLFNFKFCKPEPFVERYLRVELPERTTFQGEIRQSVDMTELPRILEFFRSEDVGAIAICFLHAYANPSNEIRVAEAIREQWPEVSVLASHEVSREWREYERTNTTVLSAYVQPIARTYLEALEKRLEEDGCASEPYVMQSNGGIATVQAVKDNPITMIESGPASGIFAAAYMGRIIGFPNIIALDIGGTTAKCTLIEDGNVKVTTQYHIERDARNPGYPVQTPVSEIVEIGNGGGSIAWVDAGGKLHVGPQSAGARPGPAAYGMGGTNPTTTDANLVLGRIDPANFAGGKIQPDWAAIDRAFEPLCERLECSAAELARGILRIANANMTNALRLVSTNKGHDPRDFVLMAYGGGGAMHAVALAEELHIPKVIVPIHSSVFSAWGMLLTDLRRDFLATRPTDLSVESMAAVEASFDELESQAKRAFIGEEAGDVEIHFKHFADLRYFGQEHSVKVPISRQAGGSINLFEVVDRFHDLHRQYFTYTLDAPVQVVNYHLVASVNVEKPRLHKRSSTGRTVSDAKIGDRLVDFDQHGIHSAAIYDGLRMEPGMQIQGPAVIQEPNTTILIHPRLLAGMDDYGNYHIDLGQPA